jgi:hypothetical protein
MPGKWANVMTGCAGLHRAQGGLRATRDPEDYMGPEELVSIWEGLVLSLGRWGCGGREKTEWLVAH